MSYPYSIGKYEVTNAQYAQFLNAVAVTDPNALYHTSMGSNVRGGITRSGGVGQLQLRGERVHGRQAGELRELV